MQIRKVIFIVDKDRRYSFDVNQNITLKNLKKMIIAAANVGNIGLRIFQNGIEYTQHENETLDYLFPNMKTVEFTLSFEYDTIDDCNELIKLRLNYLYCPHHKGKYPYFYCFTCGKSICSSCVMSSEHSGHDIKEKYDYLQSSRILVEKLFQNLKINIEGFNKVTIDELREKITINLWPILVQLLNDIAAKLSDIISNCVESESINVESIRKNMVLLKKHCADGLDELKDQISIEDMMLDENIFLTFHKRFNEIANEKDKLKLDVEQYEMYQEQLKIINGAIEKVYNDIYNFLSSLLNTDYYNNILHDIERKIVCAPINRKEIFDKILEGIKPRTKPFKSEKKNIGDDYEKQLKEIENIYPGDDPNKLKSIPHINTAGEILLNVNQKYNIFPTTLISPIKVSNPDGYVGTIMFNNRNLRGAPMRYKYEDDINLSLPEIQGNVETVYTKRSSYIEKNVNIGAPFNQVNTFGSQYNSSGNINENTNINYGMNASKFNAAVNNANTLISFGGSGSGFKSGYQTITYTTNNNENIDNNNNYNNNQDYNIGYSSMQTHSKINALNNNNNQLSGSYTSVGNGNIGYTSFSSGNNIQQGSIQTGHFNMIPSQSKTTTTTIINKQYTNLENNNIFNEGNIGESSGSYTFQSGIRGKNKIQYQSDNAITTSQQNIFGPNERYICQPIEGTNEVLIYTCDIETITRKQVEFGTFTSKVFPEKCAWFNKDNKLYISGGYVNGQISEQFLRYDPIRNSIERLHDLPEKRHSHTMIIDDKNNLYVVGGNLTSISKYSIEKEKWSKINGVLTINRFHPILYIRGNVLYVFFGNNMFDSYVNSVEKGNLIGNNDFTVIKNANYNLAYSTIIPGDKDSIFIIGGKGDVKESIKYNFSTNEFSSSPFILSESASFHQTIMPKLGDGIFGYFSLDDGFSFIKLSFQ
jgi:hypothetical protein